MSLTDKIYICVGMGAFIILITTTCVRSRLADDKGNEENAARIVSQPTFMPSHAPTPIPRPTAVPSSKFKAIEYTDQLRDIDDDFDWKCQHRYLEGQYTDALFCVGLSDYHWQTILLLVNEKTEAGGFTFQRGVEDLGRSRAHAMECQYDENYTMSCIEPTAMGLEEAIDWMWELEDQFNDID